jgi:hypothetical protein
MKLILAILVFMLVQATFGFISLKGDLLMSYRELVVNNQSVSRISVYSRVSNGFLQFSLSNNNATLDTDQRWLISNGKIFQYQTMSPPTFVNFTGLAFQTFWDVFRDTPSYSMLSQVYWNRASFSAAYPADFYMKVWINKRISTFDGKGVSDKDAEEVQILKISRNSTDLVIIGTTINEAQILHPAAMTFTIAFLIIMGITLFAFSSYQPLKSRGIIPVTSTIVNLAITIALGICFYALNMEQFTIASCYVSYILIGPMNQALIALSILQFLRYLTLLHMNDRKRFLVKTVSKDFDANFFFRAVKRSQNVFSQILVVGVIYLAYDIWMVIGTTPIVCFNSKLPTIFVGIMSGSLLFFLLCVLVYDLILSGTRCCNPKILWKEDGFWFRFEVYIVGSCVLIIFILHQIYSLVTAVASVNAIPDYILLILFRGALYFQQAIFPFIVTLITMVRQYQNTTPKHRDVLPRILEDQYGHDLLYAFCEAEFSVENIAALDEIARYKKSVALATAERIYAKFLNGTQSQLEVNVPQKACMAVKYKLEMRDVDVSLFKEIESGLMLNISDTFTRFMITSEFHTYTSTVNFFKELE